MIAEAGFFAAGAVAGVVYFGLLWWNTTLYLGGERVMSAALHIVRLGTLAVVLVLTARGGALPLLLTALGLLTVRPSVTRWVASA